MTSTPPLQDSWRATLLPPGATIANAIANLDTSGLQIVMVVDAGGKLAGTLTDGDIRRALLRGQALSDPIQNIVQTKPLTVSPVIGRETVLKKMRESKIHQIPIIGEGGAVVGLHLWDELVAVRHRDNLMVVLAGGRGTRLLPHTENCPKPMLPVRGKPMLEHIIDRASSEGFRRFAFAINYLGHQVEDYFGDGSRWNVEISYIRETSPLGTAGALSLLPGKPDHPVLVTNGDLVTGQNYGELLDFHGLHGAGATMAVRTEEWQNPFGVVQVQGIDITGFEEKPVRRSLINAGIYALSPSALDVMDRNAHCDMPQLFDRLRGTGHKTIVFHMHEPWLDVGRPSDLERADREAFGKDDAQ